jgi:hypothetical protein
MPEPEGGDWRRCLAAKGCPLCCAYFLQFSSYGRLCGSKGVATGCTPGDNGFPQNRGNARNKELASMVFGWSGGTRRWRARVRSVGQRRNGGLLPYLSCMCTAQGSGTGRDGACGILCSGSGDGCFACSMATPIPLARKRGWGGQDHGGGTLSAVQGGRDSVL